MALYSKRQGFLCWLLLAQLSRRDGYGTSCWVSGDLLQVPRGHAQGPEEGHLMPESSSSSSPNYKVAPAKGTVENPCLIHVPSHHSYNDAPHIYSVI